MRLSLFDTIPAAVLAFALLAACSGCGDKGPQRYNISGQILFNGQPVPAGSITFDPDTTKGNDGPQGFAHIREGRYDSTETQSGPVGGPHTVRIQGFDGKPGYELPLGKMIFSDYRTAVDLPKEPTTMDFEVPVSQ